MRIRAEESAQTQVLFGPAEEQFDAPTVPVDQRDGQRIEQELIGEEDQPQAGFRIDVADAPQRLGITTSAFGGVEPDGLVALQAAVRGDRPRLRYVVF